MRKATCVVGYVMSLFILLNLARITLFLFGLPASQDLIWNGAVDAITTIMYLALSVLLTISLTLMVNKRLLLEVQGQEEMFSKAFNCAPYAIMLARLSDGRILKVNEEFLNTTGFSRKDVLGKTTLDVQFWRSSQKRDEYLGKLTNLGSVHGLEQQFRTKAGETRTGLFSAETIIINNEKSSISSIIDITERKQAEKERLRLEQRVQQAQKAESLAAMAGAIAHNFNNMLSAAMGNLELALNVAPIEPNQQKLLLNSMHACQRAATISRSMLTCLGQDFGKAQPLDLAKIIDDTCSLLSASIPHSMLLNSKIPSPGPFVKSDRAHLTQILTNLISNGIEATAEQKGEITLTIDTHPGTGIQEARLFPTGWKPMIKEYACISVVDKGCGIPPENLDRIFDPFFSTRFVGRGLGLAVVLGLLRTIEGAISVSSIPGHGSTFRVFLPVWEQVKELPKN